MQTHYNFFCMENGTKQVCLMSFSVKKLLNCTEHGGYDMFHLRVLVVLRLAMKKSTTETTVGKSCWDWRACKIGACIILIFLVAVGAFIAYVMYQKYCCWIKKSSRSCNIYWYQLDDGITTFLGLKKSVFVGNKLDSGLVWWQFFTVIKSKTFI